MKEKKKKTIVNKYRNENGTEKVYPSPYYPGINGKSEKN